MPTRGANPTSSVQWRDSEDLTSGRQDVVRVPGVLDFGQPGVERRVHDGGRVLGAQLQPCAEPGVLIVGGLSRSVTSGQIVFSSNNFRSPNRFGQLTCQGLPAMRADDPVMLARPSVRRTTGCKLAIEASASSMGWPLGVLTTSPRQQTPPLAR